MDISSISKEKNKVRLSPYQEGVKKALEQSGKDHAMEAIQQGVDPSHIEQQSGLQSGLIDSNALSQLIQLSNTRVPTKSDGSILGGKIGVLPAIISSLSGNPTSPFDQKTEALGLGNAIQLANLGQATYKNKRDEEKFPLEIEKLKYDVEQSNPEFKIEQAKKEAQAKASFLTAADLFNKFESDAQPFRIQRDAYSRIKEVGKEPSAAGDLALIYGYMKLLDPGSTVREGEFATAQNSGSIPQRIVAMYNKVASGKRLDPGQRNDFLSKSRRIYDSSESQYSKSRREFTKLAIANKLDPESIIRDMGISDIETTNTPNTRSSVLERLGLDPNKYEVVE